MTLPVLKLDDAMWEACLVQDILSHHLSLDSICFFLLPVMDGVALEIRYPVGTKAAVGVAEVVGMPSCGSEAGRALVTAAWEAAVMKWNAMSQQDRGNAVKKAHLATELADMRGPVPTPQAGA
jgi:hypothetical protein